MNRIQLLLLIVLIALVSADLLLPQRAKAQGQLKVYMQEVKAKQWTDLQGSEVVGFACSPHIYNGTAPNANCYVVSR
jgi:hypothetical protein